MAKNNRRPTSTKSRPSWFSNFVPGDLSTEERAACKIWDAWNDDPDTVLVRLCEADYKIAVKPDSRSKGFVAFITPEGDEHQHHGWMLGGRGSSPLKAMKQACYRHFVQLDEQWPMYDENASRDEYDD